MGQGPACTYKKSIVIEDQLEGQWTTNYDNLCDIRLVIKEVDIHLDLPSFEKDIFFIVLLLSIPWKWIG